MERQSERADPDRETVDSWVAAYESPSPESRLRLAAEPVRGLAAIAELWERERVGPDEEFDLRHEIVAVEGGTAVVRVEVEYGIGAEYRDLWIVGLAADGRCHRFEEWPFWPGRPIADERSESR